VICGITHLVRCVEDLGQDDIGIFTSPARLQRRDLRWMLPVGAAFGLAMAYDAQAQQTLGTHPSLQSNMNTFSEFGSFYASGAEGAGFYFAGLATKNPKLAETGRLGAEAVIDSGTVTLLIKLASNRHRPLQGNGQGHFWADGSSHWEWDSSFPSDHATASMALARIIAGEYPHWYVQAAAYGFAESISLGRVLAKQHFPSDVILGQTIGFLTGTYLLHHRALYAGNGRRNLVSRVIDQVEPVINPASRTMGVGLRIAFGQ
jgi:membrane-associated phospholipid phosphatase